jgi:hypothetical protein
MGDKARASQEERVDRLEFCNNGRAAGVDSKSSNISFFKYNLFRRFNISSGCAYESRIYQYLPR